MKTRLRELRKERKYSLQELADKLGVCRSALGSYEIDSTEMNYTLLMKVCDLFDCSLDYLFFRTDMRNFDSIKVKQVSSVYYALANELEEMTEAQQYEILGIVKQIVKVKK